MIYFQVRKKSNLIFCWISTNINVLLLTIGMLGKQKGQILRVAASFQVLFSMNGSREGSGSNSDINLIISDKALLASINFVELCCQQAAYIAGRGDIKDDIKNVKASKTVWSYVMRHVWPIQVK